MSRTLKRIDIEPIYKWKSGVTTSSITVILKGSDDVSTYIPPTDTTSEHPIDNVGNYDSNGMPYFEDYPYDRDYGYKDRFTYVGDYTLNGVTYNKWNGPYSGGFYLTNVVVEKTGIQVESATCDGDGNIISSTYVKKSSYTGSFVTNGSYTSLSDTATAYLHEVIINTTSNSDNRPLTIKTFIINDNASSGSSTWSAIQNEVKGNAVIWYYTDDNSQTYNDTLCKLPSSYWFLAGHIIINTPTSVTVGTAQEIK